MNNRYNKSFEENLRRRLEQEELGFDEKAWEMMEGKLDSALVPWFKSRGFVLGSSILGIFLLLGLGWNLFLSDHQTISATSQESLSKIQMDEDSNTETSSNLSVEKMDLVETNVTMDELDLTLNTTDQVQVENGDRKNHSQATVLYKKSQESEQNSVSITTSNHSNNTAPTSDYVFNNQKNRKNRNIGPGNDSHTQTAFYDKINVDGIIKDRKNKKDSKKVGLIDEKKNYIKGFSLLTKKMSSLEDAEWMIDDPEMIEIEEHIDIPKHYVNLTIGGGMANLAIDDPTHGDLKPISGFNRELFLSLSYLYRLHNRFGIEAGVQAQLYQFIMNKTLEEGTFNLDRDHHLFEFINHGDVKLEPFVNLHFFQRINRRLDLDIYTGFYANGLPASGEQLGYRSSSSGKIGDTWLLSQKQFYGATGRLKVGANFNILTSKLNTVGIGVSYAKNLYGSPQGSYALFQNADNSLAGGNFTTNGDGFKIQLTYGFGLDKDRLDLRYMDKEKVFGKKNYFLSLHFGIRSSSGQRILNDCNTGDCINFYTGNSGYVDFSLGHYISDKWALGIGLGYQNIRHFVPFDPLHHLYYDLAVFNVPTFIQYDFFTKGRINLYGQIGLSFDFSRDRNVFAVTESYHPRVIADDKLNTTLRTAVGADFKLFKGLSIGIDVKRQIAFNDIFEIEKEVSFDDERIVQLGIRNTYFMGGVNLKYLFTN